MLVDSYHAYSELDEPSAISYFAVVILGSYLAGLCTFRGPIVLVWLMYTGMLYSYAYVFTVYVILC